MIASNVFVSRQTQRPDTMTERPMDCTVQLIDRRTGRALRINGAAMVVPSRQPGPTVAALLAGRDPAIWEARVTRLAPEGPQ